MFFIFGILGIIGGFICACGDLLLDLKGVDNKKLGKYQIINSKWADMGIWRFYLSILLVMAGVPLAVPLFTILFTPLSLLVIGVTLRCLKYEWFFDLPGIIMPSVG